jgi:hypothetical protein
VRFQQAARQKEKDKQSKVAGFINTMIYEDEEGPGNYKVPYDPKKMEEVKFDDSRAKLLELYFNDVHLT